ncbi:prephenate dehydrogenase [Verrucomicrobiales bacterium]|nr:prephenate dehydrogenase [Verrucomicrobiales bacterium]MDC0048935.1 prephenate dehydrogenase [Verrucomicrobiota bacterium]NCG26298.1 prephenate dehydrogenase/arogenate dehydrogenase family protein [Verrucomicrobiales bacterium]
MELESNSSDEGAAPCLSSVSIIGPGLLGGSVALASKHVKSIKTVSLWARRKEALAELNKSEAADVISDDIAEVVGGSDLVVLATPVGAVENLVKMILPHLKKGAVITDLCSVKASAVNVVDKIIAQSGRDDVNFVGAHPMAGSESGGFANARADLFEGAVCAVTPSKSSNNGSEERVVNFWQSIGCQCVKIDSRTHDELVARVSHLPHVIASAIVETVFKGSGEVNLLAGPGLRSMTRIAGGSPDMWAEIICQNKDAIGNAMEDHIELLNDLLKKIRDADYDELHQFLGDAKEKRNSLYPPIKDLG